MMDQRVDWCGLPKELWPLITKHFNASIDVLSFRSVCKTWRSSFPLPLPHSLSLFPPQLPIPHAKFSILQTKIYRLQPHPLSPSPSSSNSNSKGWIIKVGESKSTPLRLLDPLTNFPLSPNTSAPKVLNLLNFKALPLFQAYTLNLTTQLFYQDESQRDYYVPVPNVRKLVLFPNSHVRGCMVFALYNDAKLGVSNIGDENWSILEDGNQFFDDMILHQGQLYVVDKWGTVFWVDCSNLKFVQFSPLLCGFGKRKHLVECGESLYVVDMYIEGEPDNPKRMYYEVVDIKVYKLDEEWGRWVDVKNLGDVLFVLGKDSNFSLSAEDYYGCEGNSIYFYAAGRAWCFRLDNSNFKSPNPFCPCPTLFQPKFNL